MTYTNPNTQQQDEHLCVAITALSAINDTNALLEATNSNSTSARNALNAAVTNLLKVVKLNAVAAAKLAKDNGGTEEGAAE